MKKTDEKALKIFVSIIVTVWLVSVGVTIVFFAKRILSYAILFLIMSLVISYYTLLALVALANKDYRSKTMFIILHDVLFVFTYLLTPIYVVLLFMKKGNPYFIIPCGLFVVLSHANFIPYIRQRISSSDKDDEN